MYRLYKNWVGIGWVGENARISENAWVGENARISENAWIGKNAWIKENARIGEGAWIGKGARIGENARIGEGAEIKSIYDYMTVGGIGSRQGMTTFYRCKDGLIRVNCGCFNGTLDDFKAKVHKTHAGTIHERAYMAAIHMAKEIMIHD
jgi:acetyltransferase-like isoleucine patch superfamily enzyme